MPCRYGLYNRVGTELLGGTPQVTGDRTNRKLRALFLYRIRATSSIAGGGRGEKCLLSLDQERVHTGTHRIIAFTRHNTSSVLNFYIAVSCFFVVSSVDFL